MKVVKTVSFSQTVASLIETAWNAVRIAGKKERLKEIILFFTDVKEDVKITEFSNAVAELLSNPFCGDMEKGLLRAAVVSRLYLMHPLGALKPYLEVIRDEDIAGICVRVVLSREPDSQIKIGQDDPFLMDIKRAFTSVEVLAPEQLSDFSEIVLEMFPNLDDGVHNLLYHSINQQYRMVSKDNNGQVRPVVRMEEMVEIKTGNGNGKKKDPNGGASKDDVARHIGSSAQPMGNLGSTLSKESKEALNKYARPPVVETSSDIVPSNPPEETVNEQISVSA